jgi:hypothetical protein
MKTSLATACCMALLLLPACASAGDESSGDNPSSIQTSPVASASTGSPTGGSGNSYVDGGRLAAQINFSIAGIMLSPPSPTQLPTVSEATLPALCGQVFECPEAAGVPTIFLALITTDDGGAIQADGSVTPNASNTLGWVMRWEGVPCSPGGGGSSDSTQSQSPTTSCTFIAMVDAASGRPLGSSQTNEQVSW